MIGQNIGKYRVGDRIGKGGMGTVYRAMDETLHREVAIKVLNAELNDPEVARRFRAEAITVARLSHPGIATIYELFEHEGQWLMVMEFVRGETFESLVNRMGPLSAQRSADLCMQALAALAHAHSMGVVHRDLKPANLMITENGAVKVMDFGIARVSGSEHLTSAGFMMGTPAYMAPEQVHGGDVDARADLYAMGVVFYRLTTAKLPFKGETAFAMVQSQVNDPPTPIGLIRADLPNWVEEIVTRALAKAPEHRFQSAAEFHEALARCMAGLPISSMYTAGDTGVTPARMPSGAFPSRAMPTPSASFPMPMSPPPMAAGPTSAELAAAAPTILSRSGASVRPDQAAPGAPATRPVATQAQPPLPPTGTVAVRKPIPLMWIGLAGAALLAIVVTGLMMSKDGSTPPAPSPSATADASPAPPPAAADPTAAAAATGNPGQAGAPAPVSSPPAASPAVTPVESPAPGPVSAGRSGAAGAPASGAAVSARSGSTPGAPAGADPLATFSDVKMYEISGKRAVDRDVVLNFVNGQLAIAPRSGGSALISLPYRRVTHATYVRARDPKWDPKLASPPEGFDASSFIGTIIRSARHWLVVQGTDHFEILRLEDSNVKQILETFETRTGVKINRPKGQ